MEGDARVLLLELSVEFRLEVLQIKRRAVEEVDKLGHQVTEDFMALGAIDLEAE